MPVERHTTCAIMLYKTLIACAICVVFALPASGQTDPNATGFVTNLPTDTIKRDTVVFDIDVDISDQLLPLDTILQIAYENSPSLKFEDAMIEAKRQNLRYTRVMFFQGFSGFYNYSVGNQSIIVTGTTPGDNAQFANGFRVGVNLSLPLSTLFGQGARNKVAKAELQAAKMRKEEIRLGLKREILTQYVNMMEGQRKMKIRAEDAQSALATVKIAEEELIEGKIPSHEYSRLQNIYAIAQTNVENERANFLRAFYDFEALVGVDIRNLKKPAQKKP